MNKKNKNLMVLLLVLCVGLIGLTIAYFSNSTTINNEFITEEYGTTYTQEFVSPDNWLPGDISSNNLDVENIGDLDVAVRISYTEEWIPNNSNETLTGWIHADGTKSNHTTEQELANDVRAALINFANEDDWTKVGDYYYYNYKLAKDYKTSSFIESVTFNPITKLGDTCTETQTETGKTVTCNSSGADYDHATYKLTITIETVQYNRYNEAWNLNNSVTITG